MNGEGFAFQGDFMTKELMTYYTRPEGVMGGPCLHCHGSQPEHVGLTCQQVLENRSNAIRARLGKLMPNETSSSQQNVGHGHVFPRPDGVKARCGGPAMCSVCAADLAADRLGKKVSVAREPSEALTSNQHLPCPFCGDRDIRAHHKGRTSSGEWVIECHSCSCELTGFPSEQDAWKTWDGRSSSPVETTARKAVYRDIYPVDIDDGDTRGTWDDSPP